MLTLEDTLILEPQELDDVEANLMTALRSRYEGKVSKTMWSNDWVTIDNTKRRYLHNVEGWFSRSARKDRHSWKWRCTMSIKRLNVGVPPSYRQYTRWYRDRIDTLRNHCAVKGSHLRSRAGFHAKSWWDHSFTTRMKVSGSGKSPPSRAIAIKRCRRVQRQVLCSNNSTTRMMDRSKYVSLNLT